MIWFRAAQGVFRVRHILPVFFLCIAFVSLAEAQSDDRTPVLYWSDADSGQFDGVKFRLANIDAPETGSLKQRGGAKCEDERRLGYDAKALQIAFTRGKAIVISKEYGLDHYGRLVVDMTAGGEDVGTVGINRGYLRPWPFKNGKALAPKPDWCSVG